MCTKTRCRETFCPEERKEQKTQSAFDAAPEFAHLIDLLDNSVMRALRIACDVCTHFGISRQQRDRLGQAVVVETPAVRQHNLCIADKNTQNMSAFLCCSRQSAITNLLRWWAHKVQIDRENVVERRHSKLFQLEEIPESSKKISRLIPNRLVSCLFFLQVIPLCVRIVPLCGCIRAMP